MTPTQLSKLDRICAGERVICTDADLDAFADDDRSNGIRTICNPQQAGTLDRWIASVRPFWRATVYALPGRKLRGGVTRVDSDPFENEQLARDWLTAMTELPDSNADLDRSSAYPIQ